jgi:putative ABC transport system ATP-binding protein
MSRHAERPLVNVADVSAVVGDQTILQPTSLDILSGFTALTGPSGAGKSTLGAIVHGLRHPDTGQVFQAGIGEESQADDVRINKPQSEQNRLQKIGRWLHLETRAEERLAKFRSTYLGYSPPTPYIAPYYTAEQYIRLPQQGRGNQLDPEHVDYLIDVLGVAPHLGKYASQLSDGEAQRVGIVAALAHKPEFVFADEPTSALDGELAKKTLQLFKDIADTGETSFLVVSHSADVIDYADHIISMRDGHVVDIDQ